MKIRAYEILAMVLALMAVMPLVNAAYEETASVALNDKEVVPNIQVLTLKYEPFPVNPGEYVDVWLKVGNEGDADIDDFAIELVSKFPFSIDSGETATRHYGKILANSIVLVHYKVRVSEDAVEGDNFLKFRYRYVQSNLKWIDDQVKIRVQTREAVLSIDSVQSDPEKIAPGENAKVTITLKNMAGSVIRDIGVILDLTMATVAKNPATLAPTATVIDSYYNAIPLAPINSSTEKRFSYIKPGEEIKVVYNLAAFPDAKAKTYKVPLLISYQDEIGRNYTKLDVVGLVIGAEPDMTVNVQENTVYGAGAAGDVSIKFVNKGATDVRFMNVLLKDSKSYDIVSAKTIYIGDLDSDDYETADFKLYVKSLEKDSTLKLPLHIEYKDSNGIDYKKDITLDMKVYSKKEMGLAGNGSFGTIVLVLIVLAVAWLLYKRWEKKKRKKQ